MRDKRDGPLELVRRKEPGSWGPDEYPDFASLGLELAAELKRLPMSKEIWYAGRFTVEELSPEHVPAHMIIVVDEKRDLRASVLIDPQYSPGVFTEVLGETMELPQNVPPRRPSKIRVKDPRLALMLRQALTVLDIKVEATDDLEPLDITYKMMSF